MPEAMDSGIRWSIQLWESLFPNKTWVIPRSGTVFRRDNDRLVFIEGSEQEYEQVKPYFEAIGVEVVRNTRGA